MAKHLPTNSPEEIVAALKQRIRRIEGVRPAEDDSRISSGCVALDRLLPDGGWKRGSLIEWLSAERGSGAGTLAIVAAREAAVRGGAVVVMDNQGWFYPPAAAALGMDLGNLIVIRAANPKDQLWALDQTLRCDGVAAVWAPQEKLDPHSFRRLQLAVESGGTLGLLLRDAGVRGRPSWSDVQLLVQPRRRNGSGWRMRVELIRCRGGRSGGAVELEMDDVTGVIRQASQTDEAYSVHPPAQLARAARRRRSAGA